MESHTWDAVQLCARPFHGHTICFEISFQNFLHCSIRIFSQIPVLHQRNIILLSSEQKENCQGHSHNARSRQNPFPDACLVPFLGLFYRLRNLMFYGPFFFRCYFCSAVLAEYRPFFQLRAAMFTKHKPLSPLSCHS